MYSRKNQIIHRFLIFLLAVYFLYDLQAAFGSAANQEVLPGQRECVLREALPGQLTPVRIPEKITIRAVVSHSWERWNKRASRQLAQAGLICLFSTLLILVRSAVCGIPEHSNLPHRRILKYIHRTDGKGPGGISFS